MNTAPDVATYRFEGFVLDVRRGSLLTAAGEELPLRRQSFEMLCLLVENAGRLLDRDTINRAIWSDVAVTDDSMTQCVRDIRRAIGDDANGFSRRCPGAATCCGTIVADRARCSPRRLGRLRQVWRCRTSRPSWCCHSRT